MALISFPWLCLGWRKFYSTSLSTSSTRGVSVKKLVSQATCTRFYINQQNILCVLWVCEAKASHVALFSKVELDIPSFSRKLQRLFCVILLLTPSWCPGNGSFSFAADLPLSITHFFCCEKHVFFPQSNVLYHFNRPTYAVCKHFHTSIFPLLLAKKANVSQKAFLTSKTFHKNQLFELLYSWQDCNVS